jgi:hypothetical protein
MAAVTMMTTVSLKESGGRDYLVPTQFQKFKLTPIISVNQKIICMKFNQNVILFASQQ